MKGKATFLVLAACLSFPARNPDFYNHNDYFGSTPEGFPSNCDEGRTPVTVNDSPIYAAYNDSLPYFFYDFLTYSNLDSLSCIANDSGSCTVYDSLSYTSFVSLSYTSYDSLFSTSTDAFPSYTSNTQKNENKYGSNDPSAEATQQV